ncbi:MAG: DEAD/DEAH box helicase [Deltaproteobacteria bacterium]|nr:DEAD/DEAH box helicase [Deltaproteobacteria bacterium]
MNNYLRNMMAQMESWEAAAEFGIPEYSWVEYQVIRRSDDLYIACLSSIFDALRLQQKEERESALADIAKILVIYSRSAAARYLSGVEKRLNQLYSASLFYLAGFPATATLLSRPLAPINDVLEEEAFLHGFLGRQLNEARLMDGMLLESFRDDSIIRSLDNLYTILEGQKNLGLREDPRKFIAAKLTLSCLERFAETNVWDILRQYAAHYTTELWQPFLGNTRAFPLWELLPSQLTAIRAGILGDDDETFSLQMPTSAGKTALCELLIYHEVKARNRRVLFLVPFRALAAEIRDGMSQRLSDAGVRVIASHGGNIPTRSETITVENADVLIITPEKFTALSQVVPGLGNRYQTIICDEGHLIDDDTRGLQYELLLTKLRGTENAPRKLVFISAILPNVNEIHEWLGGQTDRLAHSDYRPVETDYAFLSPQPRQRHSWQLDVNPIYARPRSYFLLKFLDQDDFRYLNRETGRLKLIAGWNSYVSLACAAALKARRNGSVALFTTSRGDQGIRGLAHKLITLCEFNALVAQNSPQLSDQLPLLVEFVEFILGSEYLLTRLLRFGAGFHHGMLPQELRREMEESIQDGIISILICTTTLAEGVNLPIRTLVVHTVRRYNSTEQRWEYLHNRSIKNIVGRAGRAGKETRGRVLFINDTEQNKLKEVLQDQAMESAHGALYRLIVAINDYVVRVGINLNNDIIDRQTDPKFLSLIDSIDFTLLDLIPADTPQEQINHHIDELLARTLAKRYCNTEELRICLETVFRLRVEKLQQ